MTSETTSGTWSSLRQADELSITVTPAAANRGAWTRDIVAPAENTAMSRPRRVGCLGVLDFDLLAAERQLAALRTGRCEKPHAGRREIALVQQPAHHLAHLAGGTYNTYGNHLTSCPRIHRGLFGTAEAECFVQRDNSLI